MTRVTYFRYATLLPIILPIVLAAIAFVAWLIDMRSEGLFAATAVLLTGGLMFGPGYLAMAGLSLFLLRRCSQGWYVAVGLLSPLIFAASVPLALLPIGWSLRDSVEQWRSLATWCCAVGYFYVVTAFAGLWFLKNSELVD